MVAEPLFRQLQSEAQFQEAVQQYATLNGWSWMHIQKAMNERTHWRTPVSGPLGSGWPDLVLVRNTRLLFVELKSEKGKATAAQETVLSVLTAIPCAEVYVWRPSDWELVMRTLSR